MRKRVIAAPFTSDPHTSELDWLDLARLATVEVTSEAPAHPVEGAILVGGTGWRAAVPGPQAIRLRFDTPTRIGRVLLAFREGEVARTQEFVLRWSADGGHTYREVVRQQYTFSPPGTVAEAED